MTKYMYNVYIWRYIYNIIFLVISSVCLMYMYVQFYFCVWYMWESHCVFYPIIPIYCWIIPNKSNLNPVNFSGGGVSVLPRLSSDSWGFILLFNFCQSKYWYFFSVWKNAVKCHAWHDMTHRTICIQNLQF